MANYSSKWQTAPAELKEGATIYRYAFNFSKGTVDRLEAKVTHVSGYLVMYSYIWNGKVATSSTRAFYDGSITTKGTTKYVWLTEDDFGRAKEMVRKALEDRKADIRKSLEAVENNLKALDEMGV